MVIRDDVVVGCAVASRIFERGYWLDSAQAYHSSILVLRLVAAYDDTSEAAFKLARAGRVLKLLAAAASASEQVTLGRFLACLASSGQVRSGQVRFITRPKSRTMRAKRKKRSRAIRTKVPK